MRRKVVAVLGLIVFFAITLGVFHYTPPNRPWWLTVVGYLASILALGAVIEIFKDDSSAAGYKTPRSKMTDREYTIVSRYGAVLEKRSEFLSRESDLPFPKEEIRTTLVKAQQDPGCALIKSVVNLCMKALDTYMPEEEYEKTQDLISRCFDLVRRGDSEGFSSLLAQVSEHQRKAFQVVVDMNAKAKSVAGELPMLEEKLQAIEAIVDEISKSSR